jgi:hypothetical protein
VKCCNYLRAFTDGGRHALDRTGAHVPDCEDAGAAAATAIEKMEPKMCS